MLTSCATRRMTWHMYDGPIAQTLSLTKLSQLVCKMSPPDAVWTAALALAGGDHKAIWATVSRFDSCYIVRVVTNSRLIKRGPCTVTQSAPEYRM